MIEARFELTYSIVLLSSVKIGQRYRSAPHYFFC